MQARKRESDPWLVGAAIVLVLLGLLNLISTGMTSNAVRHALFGVAGIGVMYAVSRLQLSDLRRFGWVVLVVSTVMLAGVLLTGVAVKGAKRWLDLGLFTIQPSELAKLGLVLVPASLLAAGYTLGRLVAVLSVTAVPVVLVAMQPDLSTAAVLAAIAVLMLILARVPLLPLLPLFAAGLASLPLAVLFLRPYQLERIRVLLSSDTDEQGSGWAELQADIAIGSGGLRGMAGDPLYDIRAEYLPESEHDLAFASIVYGWGLFAGLAVVVAVLVIVWRAAIAARTARTREAALVAGGVAALFGIHGVVAVGASLSVLPHGGMPIPLFSYGGTAAIIGFVAIGLVLAIRRDGVARPLWAPPRKRSRQPRGISAGALIVTASLVAMSVFTWQLQKDRGEELRALSDQQMMRCIRLPAERGAILDRHGVPLAVNVAEYTVAVVSLLFDSDSARNRAELAALLGTSPDEMANMLQGSDDELQVVVGTATPDQVRHIMAADIPGVLIYPSGKRHYPHRAMVGTVLGHVGVADPDDMQRWPHLALGSRVGKSGIEKQYDALLRGSDGKQCVYVDPGGRPVAPGERVDPIRGHDLRLHLDFELQELATNALTDAVRTSGGDVGAAIVMDVRTGAVLTMASVPGFDNNIYGPPVDVVALSAQLDAPGPGPLLNHVTQTAAPPGSTFKIVTAAANAEFNVLSPDVKLAGGASYTYGGHTFRNWKPMGPNNLVGALQWSDNVYFYQLADLVGPERIAATAAQLGVGQQSGIDLPGEAEGFLGTPETVASIGGTWYPGSTLLMGIGQGAITATPIQLARWTSGISTGAMVTPQLAAGYGADATPIPTDAPVPLPFADRLGPVRAGMLASGTAGTGGQLASLPVPVGTKTGTAEDPSAPGEGLNAWFSAVAPFDSPEIVVSVLVRGGGFGSATAGPVVKPILERYLAERPVVPPNR